MSLTIKQGISITKIDNLENNYICTYHDENFTLVSYYDEKKFNEYYLKLDDLSYQFELLLLNNKDNTIINWIVNVCEYLSSKKIDNYEILDKTLLIIVGNSNELY